MASSPCHAWFDSGARSSQSSQLVGQEEEALQLVVRCVEANTNGEHPNRILVVQLGTNVEEATVLRAHAVPQELCENLINALKLLANHQRDGDNPIQNFVTGLREKKGNVLRTNRCVVEVGHLRKGQRSFRVKKTENM